MKNEQNLSPVEGVHVGERIIPVPTSISQEAQAMLRAAVQYDGTPLNALYPIPAPNDRAAWRQLQAAAEAHYAAALSAATNETSTEIVTRRLGTATVHVALPESPRLKDCVFIDLHGGALVFGGGDACRESTRLQANRLGMTCYGIDYRMPPDHPYPAALDDCLAVYRHVIDHYGADRVVLGGRSAGGNLALATILRARDEGLRFPAGVVLLSPELDLTESGDSFQTNRTIDVVLPNPLMRNNLLYAGGADLAHPYLSRCSERCRPSFRRYSCRAERVTCSSPIRCGSIASCDAWEPRSNFMCSRRCRMVDSRGLRKIWSLRRK